MAFVQSAPSGDPSLRDPESELTPPGGTPASALAGEAPREVKPALPESSAPAPPAFSFAGTAGHDPWPLGVADAAAEFAAIRAGALAHGEPAEPARAAESSPALSEPSLPTEVAPVVTEELLQPVPQAPAAVTAPESEQETAQPPPVANHEATHASTQSANPFIAQEPVWEAPPPAPPVAAPAEPDGFSVEWAPAGDSAVAAASSPAQMPASSSEPRPDEPANPAQSSAEGGGYTGPAFVSEPAALAAAPAEAAPASSQAAKLDLGRDVDWSEDVLARAARAAAAAATRARAQQQPELAAGGASSQRSPAAQRAQSRARSSRSEIDEGVASERSARHKTRKARRARFVATPLFVFAFVGCVMVALGVGFVTGFMIGRETPRTAEATAPRVAEPEAPVAAEPAGSAAEATALLKKGALTSRVEAVAPQPGAPGAPGLVGEPAAAAAPAPGAAAKLQRAPFDPKAAGAAVSRAGARAGVCVQPGDAGGEAVVTVTLDPSGVTSSAAVYGARFSGTQAGECIAGLMREVKVRPFTGDPVTVKKTIQVR